MPSVLVLGGCAPRKSEESPYDVSSITSFDSDFDVYCTSCQSCDTEPKSKWRRILKQQLIYAQYFKLLVLFIFALAHVFYIADFLLVFRVFEDSAISIHRRYPDDANIDANAVRYIMRLLVDYKKNMWMSVGAMCAALSTSCFFLLLVSEEASNKFYVYLMRVVDMVSFLSLPCLFLARLVVVKGITAHLNDVLLRLARVSDPHNLINSLKCSLAPREQLPLCASVIERAIFPVVVLEYLLVLAIITAAYIGLAYLIVYCIRHWFPHAQKKTASEKVYGPLIQA